MTPSLLSLLLSLPPRQAAQAFRHHLARRLARQAARRAAKQAARERGAHPPALPPGPGEL